MPAYRPISTPEDRIESWKAIAAYFEKDVRTVRRWELERGLPVHRVRGGERGSVFAYVAELEAWLREKAPESGTQAAASEAQSTTAKLSEPTRADLVEAPGGRLAGQRITEPAGVRGLGVGPEAAGWIWQHGARLGRGRMLALFGVAGGLALAVALLLHAAARPVGGSAANAARHLSAHTPDKATLDLYLHGRYLWSLRTEASLTQAVDLFTQAIVRDPNYAPAYAGLADSYLLLRQYGHLTDAEAYPRAYFASRRALALDDSAAEAHRSYAFVLDHWMWNFPAAEVEFRRAIALDPKDAQSHQWYATSLLSAGRAPDALREIDIARQLQPGSVPILVNRGLILGSVDISEGISVLSELEQTNSRLASLHTYLSGLHFEAKQYPEFLREARDAAVLRGELAEVRVLDEGKEGLERGGERGMLLRLARGYGALAEQPASPHAPEAALYYSHLRDAQHTLHFLALSWERRESNLQPVRFMKEYEFLHGNPQFEALLQRMRSPYALAEADDPAVVKHQE